MSTTQGSSSVSFEETVKDFVATRPRRALHGRVGAGVAAGIGRRYGIDPVIVRIALVVTAFYGGGVTIYLLGWLLLAREDDDVSGFEGMVGRAGRTSMGRSFAIALSIAAFIPFWAFFFGNFLSSLAGMLVLLGGLFLLHRYRADQGVTIAGPTTPGVQSEMGPMTDSTPTSALHPESDPAGPQDRVPPAWDPLGAAPFAWDLPEPTPTEPVRPEPQPVPARHRSRIGLATFGIALVVGAVLFAVAPNSGWLDAPHIIGILAGIVGIGLVGGSFVRGGRGLIPLAVLLSGLGFLMTSAHLTSWHGVGDARFTPTSAAEVQPLYERSVGDLRLDLTELPNTGTVTTQVRMGLGEALVYVPTDADVLVTCSASLGDVNCLDQRDSGPNNPTVHAHQVPPGADDGLHIVLNVQGGTGDVRVLSGAGPTPPDAPNAPNAPNAPTH